MIHPELVRLRLSLGPQPDPKLLYRYRVDALKLGGSVSCVPGDKVHLPGSDEEGRVLAAREQLEGPDQVWVQVDGEDEARVVDPAGLKIVTPHRPAMLLGEDELLHKRLPNDVAQPETRRALETLGEVARREEKEGIPAALQLLVGLDGAPSPELHDALKALFRSRASGEVEVALRKVEAPADVKPLVEIPALAASAPDEQAAEEVLDSLAELTPEQAVGAIARCGRWLVGAGGPGFARASVRERVSDLAREHADKDVRVALFVHAARALQPDDMLEQALGSDQHEVRAAAAQELLRRGHTDAVWTFLEREQRIPILLELLGASKTTAAVAPLSLLANWLKLAEQSPDDPQAGLLRDAALLRVSELPDASAGLELLEPWLSGARQDGLGPAIWSAGLLGDAAVGARILGLVAESNDSGRLGTGLEALVRCGAEQAEQALDAWGVELGQAGLWGEELVDAAGFQLGREVEPGELLARFTIDPPQGPVRQARGLDVARALHQRGETNASIRTARELAPSRWPRFAELVKAAG